MIVDRTVTLSNIAPAMLNLRTPVGLEVKLNVAFLNPRGGAVSQDLAAQLQLTGRSTARTAIYQMPSTDVVNGKARAIIPADSLTDPNGYRLRLVGSVNGEATLLAMGKAEPIAATGFEAIELDTIDQIDLTFERNENVSLDVKVWSDDSKDSPYDLTSTTILANVYDHAGGAVLVPFAVAVTGTNQVTLSLTIEQVNVLPDQCWWTMAAAQGGGLTTLAEGNVTVTGTVTQPLPETILNYNYMKPDNADPVSGEIVHGNFTQNVLKVAKIDADTTDRSDVLALAVPGDQILAGATTWTITSILNASGWYEFGVLPVQQAAVSGLTPVTFRVPPPEVPP